MTPLTSKISLAPSGPLLASWGQRSWRPGFHTNIIYIIFRSATWCIDVCHACIILCQLFPLNNSRKVFTSQWQSSSRLARKLLPCHPQTPNVHRENGGTLGVVPLMINPIYTLYSGYIYWVYIPFYLEMISSDPYIKNVQIDNMKPKFGYSTTLWRVFESKPLEFFLSATSIDGETGHWRRIMPRPPRCRCIVGIECGKRCWRVRNLKETSLWDNKIMKWCKPTLSWINRNILQGSGSLYLSEIQTSIRNWSSLDILWA